VARPPLYERSVFVNCPFSPEYQGIFRALIFSVLSCGYEPRCALEVSDSTQNRLSKIEQIIERCRFGIHDISFMELDARTKLPRFNMPFELGMFFAAKRFGVGRQRRKIALILDAHGYRYRSSLSDISGQDIAVHSGSADTAIHRVRDWLNASQRKLPPLPGGSHIVRQYRKFTRQLPAASRRMRLSARQLTYPDLCRAIEAWLKNHA
jgi:hypothetical protein